MIKESSAALQKLVYARTTEGYTVFLNLLKVRSAFLIFLDNKVDLDNELNTFNDYFSQLNTTEKETRKRQRALIKCVFNLLTSAQSLKEHLNIKQSNCCPKINDEVLLYFFRELRNLVVHNTSFPLISKRKVVIKDGESIIIVEQTINKAVFLKFQQARKEDCQKKQNQKQLKQIERVIEFVNNISDETIFSTLIAKYNQSRIDFYKGWLKNFVKANSKSLLEFSNLVKEIQSMPVDLMGSKITNLPIDLSHLRWLDMWLSYSKQREPARKQKPKK